jgi:hypothetical protein
MTLQRENTSEPLPSLNHKSARTIDIPALMEEIRERVQHLIGNRKDTACDVEKLRAGALQLSRDLQYLNQHYAYETKLSPESAVVSCSGVLGRVVLKVKRKLISLVRRIVFEEYLAAERAFNENLVRYVNDLGRYIDGRDTQIFVELIKKIDGDVRRLREVTARIDDEKSGALGALETQLQVVSRDLLQRLRAVDAGVRGIEARVVNTSPVGPLRPDVSPQKGVVLPDAATDSLIIEGIADVTRLVEIADGSLSGCVVRRVVELLSYDQLREVCRLVRRKVTVGGRVIFEGLNPESLVTLASGSGGEKNSARPVHPDTLGYVATLAGLRVIDVQYRSPVPVSRLLREIPMDSSCSVSLNETMASLNATVRQLNAMLYGYQEYCVILEVV